MNRIGEAGEGLDGVELILQFAAAFHLRQMLGLINKECRWPPVNQYALESQAYLGSDRAWIDHCSTEGVSKQAAHPVRQLPFDQRLLQCDQGAAIVVLPAKLDRVRSCCLHAHNGD